MPASLTGRTGRRAARLVPWLLALVAVLAQGCVDPADELDDGDGGSADGDSDSDTDADADADADSDVDADGDCTGLDEVIPLELPGPTYDLAVYDVESEAARDWLGAEQIARRSEAFSPGEASAALVALVTFTDEEVIQRLLDKCVPFLGLSGTPGVVDTGDAFALEDIAEGTGYCGKSDGLCHCARAEATAGTASIDSAEEAVNAALDWIAEDGLVEAEEDVTVDVASVVLTMPQQERTVTLGRRYLGVPMMDGSLVSVHLTHEGEVLRFWEEGRVIGGGEADGIALLDEEGINALRDPGLACYPALRIACGYVDNGTTNPAVGCGITYHVSSGDPMSDEVYEAINMSEDGQPPLGE